MWRRKLNFKEEVESSISHFSFKRLVPGCFNVGLTGSTCTALPLPSRMTEAVRPAADDPLPEVYTQMGAVFSTNLRNCDLAVDGSPIRSTLTSGRGLHSSTLSLNLSAFCGIGGACRGCLAGVQGVLGGIRGCLGGVRGYQGVFRVYYVTETAEVELKVDKCKPPPSPRSRAPSCVVLRDPLNSSVATAALMSSEP